MLAPSQIANVFASPEFRKSGNALLVGNPHYANMANGNDKNGGPNHLRSWMKFRNVNGQQMADRLGGNVTPGMVSDLVNSNRALSAKWLRRIAPILETQPGMLLDHDPFDLSADMIDIWVNASSDQRRQLVDVAAALVRQG